ncbi:MAG TPA: glycerol-3-phosphate 1-O-acyltransferase PlsY [Candidatus Hydrogenedentes bacterium]|nr:glycerol-3-phosphate 1-O-acyltransferase PlsY [Candidatus Hydrogenedentota bacterium]HNT88937.1 glycerol-3-phosphate 1-O-acyltransferase PlsY [Candidatus Hydrogenedentota bacterium]
MSILWCGLAIILSYLLGSVPTGLWLGLRLRGIDIREHGSRNIGATNTLRVLGRPLGAFALAGDMIKGVVPVLLVSRLDAWPHLPLACGVAAILGHTFSVFLRFRGGKGVATGAGVFLALAWLPTLVAAVVFAGVVTATRMVSAGSICAAITLAAATFLTPHGAPVRIATLLIALLVVWKHRSNIRRILDGEENRISFSTKRDAGAP